MENCVSVAQLNKYIKNIFDAEVMLQNISVFGEVSSYTISNGIAYFNLKDEENLLSCVLFGAAKFDTPKLGDMVLVTGSMNYYAKGGRLSFNAVKIVPYGKGLLYEKFLQLKDDLEKRGYFDPARKKAIPERVKRIGVVSSPTGAVIQDIIDVTTRRNDSIDIVLYPVKVQGVGAEFEIAQGIDFFSEYDNIDVIIVARGGGSLEDLQPFNTEVVADAVFRCQKPLVSGVGHETDYTIIDFVSDLRAPTPSAAAELVAWRKDLLISQILGSVELMQKYINYIYTNYTNSIDMNMMKIQNALNGKIVAFEGFVDKMYSAVKNSIDMGLVKCEHVLEKYLSTLNQLNPKALLDKGYTKVMVDGKIVKSKDDLKIDDEIRFALLDGNIVAKVKSVGER